MMYLIWDSEAQNFRPVEDVVRRYPTQPDKQYTTSTGPETAQALEDLFNLVWQLEADWRFDDRLGLALKQRRNA